MNLVTEYQDIFKLVPSVFSCQQRTQRTLGTTADHGPRFKRNFLVSDILKVNPKV